MEALIISCLVFFPIKWISNESCPSRIIIWFDYAKCVVLPVYVGTYVLSNANNSKRIMHKRYWKHALPQSSVIACQGEINFNFFFFVSEWRNSIHVGCWRRPWRMQSSALGRRKWCQHSKQSMQLGLWSAMRWEDGLEYSLELWSLIDGLLGFYRIKILVCHVLHKNDLPQIVSSKAMSFFQIIWGNDRKGNKRNKGLSQQDGRYSTLLCW